MEMGLPTEEPLQPDKPVKPVKPARHPDPDGEAWHAEARGRWRRAEQLRPDDPIAAFEPPALPSWSAPAHVRRELFGRYVVDRDTGVAHDVTHALETCGVDGIHRATFYHFESELPADELVDCACMEA